MGITKSINKTAKGAGKSISKGTKDAGKTIEKGGSDAGKTIEKGANEAGKTIEKGANDAANGIIDTANDTYKVATETYDFAKDFASDTAKRTESIEATVVRNTEELAKTGMDTTTKEFEELSRSVEQVVIAGVEVCYDAALDAYAWLDENLCNIALSSALAIGVEAYFTPKPDPADPGTETSTTLSAMALSILATAAEEGAKAAVINEMADICVESFLLIPGVKGQVNKKLLKNVLANSIDMTWSMATAQALWVTPVGVGIVIGAWICPIVATMVCTRTIPTGFDEALEG
jgi:hypothetical protein